MIIAVKSGGLCSLSTLLSHIIRCLTLSVGYGVTVNITASQKVDVRGSSGFDSPYPNQFFPTTIQDAWVHHYTPMQMTVKGIVNTVNTRATCYTM